MSYTQYTRAQLRADILTALGDASGVYWVADEVNRAINESLLLWGLLTSYWRERGSFNTAASTFDYDLTTYLPLLRSHAYTMGQLAREVQYAVLEPANGVLGTGMSSQFTIGSITSALARKRNEFTLDGLTPFVSNSWAIAPPPSGRTQLDQSIILVQRAAWKDSANVYYPIRRQDALTSDSANYLWNLTPGTPFAYSTAETRPIELQFVPPPAANGQLHLVYIESKDLVVAEGTSLSINDECVHGIKYGTIYDLITNNAEAADPLRAKYCLERYRAYAEAAREMKSVLRVQCNDKTIGLDTLWNLDAGRPRWMNQTGTPNLAGVACDNVWLSKVPNAVFGMTADVVRSAPLPSADADFIQVGREEIPYIFDYCRHALSFKLGGDEFTSTFSLYDSFLSGAAQRNKILAAKAKYLSALFGQPKKEETEGDEPA